MALLRLGDAYVRQMKWDDAIGALQRSIWINPSFSGPYILLGRAYMKKGEPGTAEGMLRRAVELDPNNKSAHYLLAQVLQQTGRAEEARREFEVAERLTGEVAPLKAARRPRSRRRRRRREAMAGAPSSTWPSAPGCATPPSTAGSTTSASSSRPTAPASRWLDYDDDGRLDAFVLSGTRLAEDGRSATRTPAEGAPTNRLYRNRGDGTFADVTEPRRSRRTGWASGVCAGDYDNDGRLDLFVTYYGQNVLYRNRGGGFEDVTARAGLPIGGVRWGSGCSFVDYDRDGRLDLFVSNYLSFDLAPAAEPGGGANCVWKGIPVNCGPKGLPTDVNLLYRNHGDGTFEDVSAALGHRARHRALPDDRRRRRFRRGRLAGHLRGLRLDGVHPLPQQPRRDLHRRGAHQRGRVRRVRQRPGGDGPGRRRLRPRRAARHPEDALRRRRARALPRLGSGLFEDAASQVGLAVQNRHVEWGAGLPDLDNDGWPDVVYVTGHVYPEIERHLPQYPHRGPRMVFQGAGRPAVRGRVRAQRAGGHRPALEPRRRLRRLRRRRRPRRSGDEHERAAVAAAQRDEEREPVAEGEARGHAVQPRRHRRDGDRDRGRPPPGAGRAQPVELLLARRPAPALRPRARRARREKVEVRWPSGGVDVVRDVAPNRVLTVREGAAARVHRARVQGAAAGSRGGRRRPSVPSNATASARAPPGHVSRDRHPARRTPTVRAVRTPSS